VQAQAPIETVVDVTPRRGRLTLGTVLVLACLLAAGAIFRFYNLNWDAYQHVHPDERFIVWVADTMHWPGSLGQALDPRVSPLNPFRWPPGMGDQSGKPRDYAYGHLPLYLLLLVSRSVQAGSHALSVVGLALPVALQHLGEYAYLTLAGRALSALFDLGTTLLVFFVARRLYTRPSPTSSDRSDDFSRSTIQTADPPLPFGLTWANAAGFLAAGAYAFAVLPIQLSHYFAVDLVLTFCVVASVALAARASEEESTRVWLGAGVFAGLAVGSKFTAILLLAPLIVAAVCRLPGDDDPRNPVTVILRRLALMGTAGLIAFVVTNPFALLEARAYLRNLLAQNAMVTGVIDAPYMRQYAGSLPYAYLIQQLSQWGLGWPLGIVAWGGFVWAIVQAARRRVTAPQVVVLAWALPYFAVTGPLYAKFLRYMAPLLPFLLVFSAGASLALYRWLASRWGRRGRFAWQVGLVLVGLYTVVWVLAFNGVYRQEHPWLQASRWIDTHIPADSKLLVEHWDDALPLAMDEVPDAPPHRQYRQVDLPLWDPDNSAKLDKLVTELSSADYVVLASNRLALPIPRLARRYPMASQYYRMLFDGSLGYTPAAEFTAYPRLGGLVVPDDNADESFSVYDHPHVRIFANTGRLSQADLHARLGQYLPLGQGPQTRPPGHAMLLPQPPTPQPPAPQAPLTLSQPVDTLPVVADFRWNSLAVDSPPVAVFLWWLVVGLFGWAAWPLLFPFLGGLRDRGYGLARLIGWLVVGWVHWIGVSLGWWQNRTGIIALLLTLLVVAGLVAWWRQREALAVFVTERHRLLLAAEAVFAVAFLAGIAVRVLDPDLWQPWNGGEKFMEFAFLNAILRSPHFPPYDPYFAGGTINYYYYGLYLVSLLIKLTGIAPEVAFNLAVPGLFALTALALFTVGASLALARRAAVSTGLLAIVLGLLMSNLDSFRQVTQRLAQLGSGGAGTPLGALFYIGRGLGKVLRGAPWPGLDYWAASRVIPNTINEFPLWSFLFADLHAHLIAMPVGVTVAGLALNWVVLYGQPRRDSVESQTMPGEDRAALAGDGVAGAESGRVSDGDGALGDAIVPEPAADVAPPVEASELSDETLGGADEPISAIEDPGVAGDEPVARIETGATIIAAYPTETGYTREDVIASWLFVDTATDASPAGDDGDGRPSEPGVASALQPVPVELDTRPRRARRRFWLGGAARLALLVIILGALGPTNTWDLPVYFCLVAGAFWLAAWRAHRKFSAVEALVLAGVTGILAALAYLPFYTHYQAQVGGSTGPIWARYLAPVQASSPLQPWLVIWLFYLFVSASYVLWLLFAGRQDSSRRVILLLVAIGVALVFFMADRQTAALAALPLALAIGLLFRRTTVTRESVVLLLMALGLGILAGTELFYLRDFLEGGDWYRMNTLFKFAMPAWLLLGLACAVALPRAWRACAGGPVWLGPIWRLAAGVLLVAGLFFVPFGIAARVDDRFPGPRPAIGTLDGTAYMTVGRYSWPNEAHPLQLNDDYRAIHWLLDNVSGTPVIAEAPAGEYEVDGQPAAYDYYRAGGLRVASLTGFPTFVGQHQYEQRPGDQVSRRTTLGQEFFQTPDVARTRELMDALHVDYVYIGPLERLLFAPEVLAKFDRMTQAGELEVVYQNPGVTIYKVLR
jgi:uncharacterized membrane protein